MAVSSAFLGKVKLALRISSTSFDSQISDLIEEAILDLTTTADIRTFTTDNADAVQTGAVIAYVSYKWFGMDDKYFQAYNDQKMKMSLSSAYRPEVVEDV
ncbi:MAG: DNA-packaging protein [Lachnospiraceae bacterium]|nr:DNA-packaging protein [Lachnospiraceae bacterium]